MPLQTQQDLLQSSSLRNIQKEIFKKKSQPHSSEFGVRVIIQMVVSNNLNSGILVCYSDHGLESRPLGYRTPFIQMNAGLVQIPAV